VSSGPSNKQRPDVPVSSRKQTGRKEANESSKTRLYFAGSGHRIRKNCLGECHNEYTRNREDGHLLRERTNAIAPLSSNTVRSESFPLQTSAKSPLGKSPAISALRASHAGTRPSPPGERFAKRLGHCRIVLCPFLFFVNRCTFGAAFITKAHGKFQPMPASACLTPTRSMRKPCAREPSL